MINRTLLNAIFKAVPEYPKLEWELDDGWTVTRFWHDDRGVRFHERAMDKPECLRGSQIVVCRFVDTESRTELSIRQCFSDYVLNDITEDYAKQYILDPMAVELARAFFKGGTECKQSDE